MEKNVIKKMTMEEALESLLEKYGLTANKPFPLTPGYRLLDDPSSTTDVPLLPWRASRPFIELRNIVENQVVEHPCLFRFSCLASREQGASLQALIYREADLFEYIGGGKIASVFAVWDASRSVNLILKLDNGRLCSVEISRQLPPDTVMQERHEIIGRRGTASDRVVDTQVNQHSISFFRQDGTQQYTDTDMELFGFNPQETELIRGAWALYNDAGLRDVWRNQHIHLVQVVEAAVASGEKNQKIHLT